MADQELRFTRGGFLGLSGVEEEELVQEDCENDDDSDAPRPALLAVRQNPASRIVFALMTALARVHGCAGRAFSTREAEVAALWLLKSLSVVAVWPQTRMPAYLEELWGLIAGRTREYPLFCKLATTTLPPLLRQRHLVFPEFDPLAAPASTEALDKFCERMLQAHKQVLPKKLATGRGTCVVYVKVHTETVVVKLDEPADTEQLFDCLMLRGVDETKMVVAGKLVYRGDAAVRLKHEGTVHVMLRMRGC